MLDIKYVINNQGVIEKSCNARGIKVNINQFLQAYDKLRKSKKDLDDLRMNRNLLTNELNALKKKKQNIKTLILKSKKNNLKIKKQEEIFKKLEKEYKLLSYQLPNPLHKNVPLGQKDNIDWESKIKKPQFDFKPKNNWEVLIDLDLADFKRGIKAAGDRGWVLKGKAARLVRAINTYGFDFFGKKGYSELIPPYFVNEENLYITGHYPGGEKEVYKTEDGKVFVATGEISVLAIFRDDTFNKKELPKKFMAYTPCFRREAGTHADDKGLYRTHQFDKIELTHITTKEKEEKEFYQIFEDLKEFYQSLGLPHRIITHRADDMPNKATMEKDIEVWLAAEKRWGEVGSIGMTGSFQARRGNIRCIGEGEKEFVHTIYATGCVANRIMIAILNNFQTKNNEIEIPKVLHKYTGFKKIEKPTRRDKL
ncbi:MAG: serine--tRNA ligase [Nanoarchaeota archaeon]|nr:serine--tRNA ligase [Nanoarchaeota archaeon]